MVVLCAMGMDIAYFYDFDTLYLILELFRQSGIFLFFTLLPKEYIQFWNKLYTKQFMKSVNCSKPGHASISCSKI
jgi:hypothetical protein